MQNILFIHQSLDHEIYKENYWMQHWKKFKSCCSASTIKPLDRLNPNLDLSIQLHTFIDYWFIENPDKIDENICKNFTFTNLQVDDQLGQQ